MSDRSTTEITSVDTDEPAPVPSRRSAPITRQSLHEMVADRLRDMIIEGQLEPGVRLNEIQLCAELGVSRTPLREALKTLAGEGLIDLRTGRGAVVRRFTREDAKGMLEVLAELESLAGRQACERASDAEIAAILAAHEEMLACYAERDRLTYYKLNQQIHSMIAAASANATLIEVHAQLQARMKRLRFLGHSGAEKWAGAVAEHSEMAAALKARDADALSEVLKRHLLKAYDRIQDSF